MSFTPLQPAPLSPATTVSSRVNPRWSGLIPSRLVPIFVLLVVAIFGSPLPALAQAPTITATTPSAAGIIYGFFDDRTGNRIGRLRIERVGVEHQRHGFLRIGWRPVAVMEGVILEVDAGATWPAVGRPIIEALNDGERMGGVLREVHLTVAGPSGIALAARSGRLRADGGLELREVSMMDAAAPTRGTADFCFWLAGPDAGRLTPLAPPVVVAGSRRSAATGAAAPAIER